MKIHTTLSILLLCLSCLNTSAESKPANTKNPNIILIMADDMGYECVGVNGCESYKTPNLDKMAREGMRFTNCFANPLCTPSRVKIMTGQYNVKNYVQFRVLDRSQKTFAHYLKDAGYRTMVVGKWQLGKEPDSGQHFGFEQSLLWQHTRGAHREGSKHDTRHVNPRFELNGVNKDFNNGEFSSDVCVEFISDFMTKHKDEPMFIYYPMILPHCPFVPTPVTPDYDPKSKGSPTYKGKVEYFKDMVNHIDKMVGKIESKLVELGIADNTIIIFTGDNGTDRPVKTMFKGKTILAGKGKTNDHGMRVPLIIKFPGKIKQGVVTDELVDFTDFLPTVCELAGVKPDAVVDGVSLLPHLLASGERSKPYVYLWYEPKKGIDAKATVLARTKSHMLLRKGSEGEMQLIDCSQPFELKEINNPQNDADKAALKALKAIITEKDKQRSSSLK